MQEGFVQKAIQRSNIGSLLISAIGLIVVLVLGVLLSRYFYNMIKGPFFIAQEEIISMQKPEGQLEYYITVHGDEQAYDTGFQYVETDEHGNETVKSYYAALPLQDRFLLVRTSKPELLTIYTGSLISLPQKEQTEVVAGLESQYPQLKNAFLPMMLDTRDFKTLGYLGIAGAVAVIILCFILFVSVIRHSMDPQTHPIMRMLSAYGDPEATAMQLDSDMAMAGPKIAHVLVGQNWLARPNSLGLKAMRIGDLAWMYKQEITHRRYGVVIGKSYYAVIHDRNGKSIRVGGRQPKVDELLAALHARAPFAITGYDSRIETIWRKNRQDLINEVDRRKRPA